MRRTYRIAILSLLATLTAASGFAQSRLDGRDVMTLVWERPQPADMSGSITMTLRNARGDQRVRSLRQSLGQYDGVEKKILFFTAPADVRDTSFMTWSYEDPSRSDDQWIYLPALRRVRRISAERKSDSFMGSDFSYDDLTERHPDRDEHRLLGTETVDGRPAHIVESIPKDGSSSYGRTVTWVADDIWIGLQKEFYDKSGNLVKRLKVESYRQIGNFWTITSMSMSNADTGHSTTMELSDLELESGIPESRFSERTMTRGIR